MMFCPKCGRSIDEEDKICPHCCADMEEYEKETLAAKEIENCLNYDENTAYAGNSGKSRAIAGLLQIFLGAFGIGRFYLGYYKIAVWQIVVSLLTVFIGGSVWGFIDGIRILNGKPYLDASGRTLEG